MIYFLSKDAHPFFVLTIFPNISKMYFFSACLSAHCFDLPSAARLDAKLAIHGSELAFYTSV